VGCCYAAGAFSFWSVLGLFLGNDLFIGNDNNGVEFSLGSVPRVYFFACFWGCYWKRGESMASETLSRPTIAGFEML
jgi:hypothetical protein